ncbi:MAG: phenylalanine--tRNA ligase subunit beta [Terriglobales bacterium]
MLVSLQWLREFVATDRDPEGVSRSLTMAGLAVESRQTVEDDVLLELDISTNRPDCLSHHGVARELGAATAQTLRPLEASRGPLQESSTPASSRLQVEVAAPEACARYCARVLEDVHIQPSPSAVAQRLERLGQRTINNAADLTNYVLQEMGQPTHAFDADLLRGERIIVRYAHPGEKLLALDDVEYTLHPEDLVIADAERPVALAGVIGGKETAISGRTRRVVLESAWFAPLGIRRTAQRHAIRTDASYRFERGADPLALAVAADRIAARLQQQAGATVLAGLIDVSPRVFQSRSVLLRAASLHRLLGVVIPAAQVERHLTALGCLCQADSDSWSVTPPSWRPDLRGEADLIEEVARLHGFDRFPSRLPAFSGAVENLPTAEMESRVRRTLRGRGYAEVIALTFAAREECEALAPGVVPIAMRNPLSEEAAVLRTTPLPSMLHLLRNNLNRGNSNLRLFELGKVYTRTVAQDGVPNVTFDETTVLCLGACGAAEAATWASPERAYDFFDLKGEVEALIQGVAVPDAEWRRPSPEDDIFHPGRAAEVRCDGTRVARLGQLHPELAAGWKFKEPVYLAELNWELLSRLGPRPAGFVAPSRFPASERDFSFQFSDTVEWVAIQQAISALQLPTLNLLQPREVFRGGPIPAGEYSLLLRATFQRPDRTLREEEIQHAAELIIQTLTHLGGRQR